MPLSVWQAIHSIAPESLINQIVISQNQRRRHV